MRNVLVIVFLVLVRQNHAINSEQTDALLPRLFHLDDYNRCLQQLGGLYCLGEFELAPVGISPTYEEIQKHTSNNPKGFNRSRLYRGYCVSERCPTETEKNASVRFENCIDMRMQRYAISARLNKLQYCITQQQHAERAKQHPDAAQQLFLQVVYALLALNFVGTAYDIATADGGNKISIVTAWSVRASWRRLTATYDDGDPRLTQLEVIQGMRVMTMMFAIYVHVGVQHYQFYVTTPSYLDNLSLRVDGIFLSTSSTFIQVFVVLSSFLTAYNILLYSEKEALSFWMLPVLIIKRIIRIAPVHLLLIGFVSTYWSAMNFGPFFTHAEESSASCQRKFWAHVLFLNNIVEGQNNTCLMPSWFLAVDMHLFILSSSLTIMLYRRRHQALRLYASLSILTAVACGLVAYFMEYGPLAYDCVPEKIRGLFRDSKSFSGFYTSTWGSLPACFLGLFLAHLHYELQQINYDWNRNKWLKRTHFLTLPLGAVLVIIMAYTFKDFTQPWIRALLLAVDRLITISVLFFFIIGCINFDGRDRWLYAWRGWRVPARLSLPVMLCHWLVSVAISARPAAYRTSAFDMSIDYLATLFYSYVIAIPVALLVEIPIQRFFAQLF